MTTLDRNETVPQSGPSWKTSGWETICALGFLLLITVIFFRAPLLEQRVFYVWDLGVLYLPIHLENAEIRAEGEIPLWNRHGFLGYPTQAETELSGIYPPSVIFNLIDEPGLAYTFFIVFHYLVALASMMYLLRVLNNGIMGQAASALVFAFGGSFVSYTYGLPWITTFAWAPLVLGLQLSAFDRRSYGRAATAGIVLAIQTIGCHPQALFYVGLIMLAAMLCEIRGPSRWERFSFALKSSVLTGVVGLCLSAPQVFYLLELMIKTVRWSGGTEGMPVDRPLSPQYLLQAVIPNLLGFESRNYLFFFEKRFYFGLLSLGLIALSWNSSARHVRLFWIIMTGSLVISLGNYAGVYPLMSALPGFRQIHSPQRLVMAISLAGAVLAGVGLDRLVQEGRSSQRLRRRLYRAYAFTAVVAAAVGGLVLLTGEAALSDYESFVAFGSQTRFTVDAAMLTGFGRSAVCAAVLAGACALFWFLLVHQSFGRYAGPIALCLLAADLLVCNGRVNHYQHPEFYAQRSPTVEFLRQDPGLWRAFSLRGTQLDYLEAKLDRLPANASAHYGIDALNYHAGAQHKQIHRYFGDSFDVGDACTIKELGIFNVKYLLMPSPIPGMSAYERLRDGSQYVYENPEFQPRVAIREDYVVVQEHADVKTHLTSDAFDPTRSVVLAKQPEFVGGRELASALQAGTVDVTQYGVHQVSMDASLPRPGILLLNDLHYPGWRATSNGHEVDILLANGFVRGVALGPGRHHVEFIYRPASFYWGLRAAAVMSFILAVWGFVSVRRRVRQSKT